ncbi:myoD family inhibitor domain-containing protein 2 [Ictalurus punctatus]|uniref:MyoD family inhibitor domain-containing protein 2 n=1 Tax=Ictalurus punctatus TaxID=7998 RepID=A0A2D0RY47_ICTPU|nr:myoD family inhibitor domain-containing protein 2 [Ictalurus punctatus]
MMAGKTARSDEVIEQCDLDRAEEKSTLVQDDFPDKKVTNTAPGRTLQKLSPIPELDPGETKADAASTGSSYTLSSVDRCSTVSSSTNSLPDTQDAEDACAGIILNCLFCQFYDLCLMLPDTCKRAATQICPACSYLFAPLEPVQSSDWNCHCDIDCDLFDACQETSDCLELAMEISEICYR